VWLTHIFAACISHERLAIPKPIHKLKEALQLIWTALQEKSFAEYEKKLSKAIEASVSAYWGHFEYKMWLLT